jgi:uncharacterized damage-inducible protein DinB
MALASLRPVFQRDIHKLYREVEAYAKNEDLWVVAQEIRNSAGNLALHLIGNLNHYIGAQLGNTGYERDRDFEFHGKNVPQERLLKDIEATQQMVDQVLSALSPEQLAADYPLEVFNKKMTTEFFLIHLHGHLNYHLGQINYHRRLLAPTTS